MKLTRRAATAFLATMPIAGKLLANEESFPSRTIRLVVPLGPGSAFDAAARFFAEEFSRELGQPVVVMNKPGADTAVGVRDVLQSPADGYSILALTGSTLSITPFLSKDPPYDTRDIKPFAGMLRSSACFVVPAASPYKTLQQVVDALHAKPEGVTLGHYGQLYRYGSRVFQNLAKVRFNHVVYNSPTQTTADLIGAIIDVAIVETSAVIPLVRGGRVRALAIAGENRSPAMPDVQTVSELGWQGFTMKPWTAFAVSAKTPLSVFNRLEKAAMKVVSSSTTTKWVTDRLSEPMPLTGEQMRTMIEQEVATLAPFVKELR